MMALLRQVAPSDDRQRRGTGRACASTCQPAHGRAGLSPKLNAEWAFLPLLHGEAEGRAADAFLAAHGDDLGQRSTLDIDRLLETV